MWLITKQNIPFYHINEWLDMKSIRKSSTGKEYANKLCAYLNFLNSKGVSFAEATTDDVIAFLMQLMGRGYDDDSVIRMQAPLSYSTLSKYVTVITEFYKWLEQTGVHHIEFQTKNNVTRARKSFLYGQIGSYEYKYIIDRHILRLSAKREYIKWYTEDEVTAICSCFLTLRDLAVFLITLEGCRIDEVLSMQLEDYDSQKGCISPSRSKGKPDAYPGSVKHRIVYLPQSTREVLDGYLLTERIQAETQSGILSQNLFINMRSGNDQGAPLYYRNYWEILKRCAKKAGFDVKKIRTHSGRSTKVMQFLEHQATHPEDNISDEMVSEHFGWKSLDSIGPYRNYNNPVIAKAVFDKLQRAKEGAQMNPSLAVLKETLRSGGSLQPLLNSIGTAEILRCLENIAPDLITSYFQERAAEFTALREIATCFKLLQAAFENKKQASRFYGTWVADMAGRIADAEFEKQKILFPKQNHQQLDVQNDNWQLFYLIGPNLRSNSYNFAGISSVSLRLEMKYFLLWYLRGRGDYRTPILSAMIKGVNFLSTNNKAIHFFADISDVDARELYNYLENDCISYHRKKLSVKSIANTIRACSQVVGYLCGNMRDSKLRTPIPTGNPFLKYRFFNLDNMGRRTEIIPDEVAATIDTHIRELSDTHKTLYSIFMGTGLRLSEVILLKEDCLTPSRYEGLMLLRYVPHKTLSARRKRGIGDICEMLIPAFLSKEIMRQIKRTQSLRELYEQPYIFVVKNGNQRPVLPCGDGFCEAVNRLIEKHHIADESGDVWKLTTRQFRKTIAVTLAESGASIAELAYWLSHLTRKTSMKYYAEVRKKRLAEMNTEFFRKKFDLLLNNEQLDQFTDEQRRLLFADFRLEKRRVELGFCMRVFADGECMERNRALSCINCKNLCTGRPYLSYWIALLDSQRAVVDGLTASYLELEITDYHSYRQYQQDKALLDSYSETVAQIEAAFGGDSYGV
jgi:integrase/recombinase XerD